MFPGLTSMATFRRGRGLLAMPEADGSVGRVSRQDSIAADPVSKISAFAADSAAAQAAAMEGGENAAWSTAVGQQQVDQALENYITLAEEDGCGFAPALLPAAAPPSPPNEGVPSREPAYPDGLLGAGSIVIGPYPNGARFRYEGNSPWGPCSKHDCESVYVCIPLRERKPLQWDVIVINSGNEVCISR